MAIKISGTTIINDSSQILDRHANVGCKITYWNGLDTDLGFDNVEFHEVSVSPPSNQYFDKTIYKVPLIIKTSEYDDTL